LTAKKLPLLLYGAGIRAKIEKDYVEKATGVSAICYVDQDVNKQGVLLHGLPVISLNEAKEKYGVFDLHITVGMPVRMDVFDYLLEQGILDENILNYSVEGPVNDNVDKNRDDLLILNENEPELTPLPIDFAPKLAVHVHVFYTELLDEITSSLNHIPYKFDCFVSTDTVEKKHAILSEFEAVNNSVNTYVDIFENRGRDIAPLLVQMKDYIGQYDYICHFHSKKSSHMLEKFSDSWRKYLYKHLFGSCDNVKKIFELFVSKSTLGLIFPDTWPGLLPTVDWGENKLGCKMLADKLHFDINTSVNPIFPAGNMFWARVEAVNDLFQYGFTMDDFPVENGQKDATLAHAVERIWVYLTNASGFKYVMTTNDFA